MNLRHVETTVMKQQLELINIILNNILQFLSLCVLFFASIEF